MLALRIGWQTGLRGGLSMQTGRTLPLRRLHHLRVWVRGVALQTVNPQRGALVVRRDSRVMGDSCLRVWQDDQRRMCLVNQVSLYRDVVADCRPGCSAHRMNLYRDAAVGCYRGHLAHRMSLNRDVVADCRRGQLAKSVRCQQGRRDGAADCCRGRRG